MHHLQLTVFAISDAHVIFFFLVGLLQVEVQGRISLFPVFLVTISLESNDIINEI